jgi:hypothetical protein
LIGNHEDIPEDQDPTPSVTIYNESFGTSFRGELLSVSGELVDADGGVPKFSLLWKSPKLMGETRGYAPKKKLQLTSKTISVAEKQTSSSLQKSVMFSDSVVQVPLGTLNKKGLYITFIFYTLLIFLFFLHILLLYAFWFSQVLKRLFENFHHQTLLASAKPMT